MTPGVSFKSKSIPKEGYLLRFVPKLLYQEVLASTVQWKSQVHLIGQGMGGRGVRKRKEHNIHAALTTYKAFPRVYLFI